MFLTKLPNFEIPSARKRASRFDVAEQAVVEPERFKRVRRESIDDDLSVFVWHDRTMPSFLTWVKPNDAGLRQNPWLGQNANMDLDGKPFADIAERLRWHRSLLGMEQKEYAEKAGLQRSQLSNWETGATRLSLDGARALRKTYGLSLDFMFEGIDDALSMSLRKAWSERPSVSASR